MIQPNSYRNILRSSSIIGGASVLNVLVGLVRNKAAAVLLGPAGVGIAGLLFNLMQTAAALSALGLGTAGTREIARADAEGDEMRLALSRRALFWGSLVLAVTGAILFLLLREVLAARVLRDPAEASAIGWLSLGVFLSVLAAQQTALLNGMRRIGDLARIQFFSALLSTAGGVVALLIWRERGIIAFVIAGPLATFLFGQLYVARLGTIRGGSARLGALAAEWRILARLGFAFMISGVLATGGTLLVRGLIQRELGAVPLGQFQAAWAISMTYIGFVLSAMGTDYYPRLAGVIEDPTAAVRTVNEQTEVALLLAGPVLIATLAAAPWIIRLLYTSQFATAAEILRWQVIGDLFKVASWPLGFILVAAGAGRTYIFSETLAMTIFVVVTRLLLPLLGVMATGIGFMTMYLVYLPVIYWLGRRRIAMRWTTAVKRQFGLLVAIAAVVIISAQISNTAPVIFGGAAALVLGLTGLQRLSAISDLPLGLAQIAGRLRIRRSG